MKIQEIKRQMLKWEDFYGADIFESDRIKKAKIKKDLAAVLHDYSRHMEDRHNDAMSDFEAFRKSLGLDMV